MPSRSASTSAEPRADRRNARVLTAAGLAAFAAATVALVRTQGLILSRDWLFGWMLLGLLAVSLSDPLRWARGVLVDWLPLMIVLLCYDLSLPVREWLGDLAPVCPPPGRRRTLFGPLPP